MMNENLNKYNIILASNSPRRKDLLKSLGVTFSVKVLEDIDESYPEELKTEEIAQYISEKKANQYISVLSEEDLIITSDTIVILKERVLTKPKDKDDAIKMLREISGNKHIVYTGVTLLTKKWKESFTVSSEVEFDNLTNEEIQHYIDSYKPFDKAGAYGIQEWIGYIGIKSIKGCFYNIMGLPLNRLYQVLKKI